MKIHHSQWATTKVDKLVHNCREKATLLALASFADPDGKSCFCTVASLCKKTGLSRRTIQHHLRRLQGKRNPKRDRKNAPDPQVHIIVERQAHNGRMNEYTILCCRETPEEREERLKVGTNQITIPDTAPIEKSESVVTPMDLILKKDKKEKRKKRAPEPAVSSEPMSKSTEALVLAVTRKLSAPSAIGGRNPRLMAMSAEIQADRAILAEDRARRATMPKITESNAQELMEAMKLPA